MITKMKKLILLMSESAVDVDADLTALGKLGVVHVAPFQPAKDESIERVDARIKQLENAISILNAYQSGLNATAESGDADDFSKLERGDILLLDKVLEAENVRQQLERSKTDLTHDLES